MLRDVLSTQFGRSVHISLSSDVLPVFREVERAATTVVNAYVAPVVERYLHQLAGGVGGRPLVVMASHGGSLAPAEAAHLAASTVLSGPAAGVMGAKLIADRAQHPRFISLDMGGTSTDVALCDQDIPFGASSNVGGVSIHLPGIAIETVGAGGGSLVHCDASGTLWVGPASAGADPGPAAYGRGGACPTVADAHVILGRLPAGVPLAGGLKLDLEAARRAMAVVAQPTGTSVEAAAMAAIEVANAVMERALRRVSVLEGHDPREFTLLAFGGAGPLHACELAEALGMRQALVPVMPGALSALGLATAPRRSTASRSVLGVGGVNPSWAPVAPVVASLVDEAIRITGDGAIIEVLAETRYRGQSWEIAVAWSPTSDLATTFHEAHARRFGYARPGADIEVVTIRVRATAAVGVSMPTAAGASSAAHAMTSVLLTDGNRREVPAVRRTALRVGEHLLGPAVVTQEDATTWIAPGWEARVGPFGDLLLEHVDAG
jgi:N-methylhydantoinase A